MMKISIAVAAIGLWGGLATGPALSADMPVKAPPVQIASSWAGFYLGAHLGYGYAVTSVSDIGLSEQFIGVGGRGFTAGALVGYNTMLSSRWVGGIEADGNWQDIKSKVSFGGPQEEFLKLGWSASIRGRLGFLVTPSTMMFVTAGWAWTRFQASEELTTINGAQAGFGVETVLSGNWVSRTEYLHTFNNAVHDIEVGTVKPWVGVIRSALIYKVSPHSAVAWPDRPVRTKWTGLYAGAVVGPASASAQISAAIPQQGTLVFDGIGVSAVLPTGVLGYNMQVAPNWVVGIEGEAAPNIATSDVKVEWTGNVHGRVGYLLTPNTLAYGLLGWGTVGAKVGGVFNQVPFPITIPRVNALLWGGGVEAAVTDNWRLRADFQEGVTANVNVTVLDENGAPFPLTVKARGHTGRLGVIYQFGGP